MHCLKRQKSLKMSRRTWSPWRNTSRIPLRSAEQQQEQEQDLRFKTFHQFQQTPNTEPPLFSQLALHLTSTSVTSLRCHRPPYLAVGPFPDKISALWSRASSRPSSLLPRRLFPMSRLYYTLLSCGLTWQSFSTKKRGESLENANGWKWQKQNGLIKKTLDSIS